MIRARSGQGSVGWVWFGIWAGAAVGLQFLLALSMGLVSGAAVLAFVHSANSVVRDIAGAFWSGVECVDCGRRVAFTLLLFLMVTSPAATFGLLMRRRDAPGDGGSRGTTRPSVP